jgi:hypothetical protein
MDLGPPRPESIEVVTEPVRKGRYAVRLTVSPGDRAASKERAELKVADKELERRQGKVVAARPEVCRGRKKAVQI